LCLKGLTVAEVSPEAAVGGPLARVRDGDRIVIDIPERRIDLDVTAEELAARPWVEGVYANEATGYLAVYRRDVQPMAKGAVLIPTD
jgi:dihydroxy-acid dehydratase